MESLKRSFTPVTIMAPPDQERPSSTASGPEGGNRTTGPGTPSDIPPAILRTRIVAQPSPSNPNECKFIVDAQIREGRLVRYTTREAAQDSPLAQRLFEIPQVVATSFVGNVVTVTKQGSEPWQVVARQIGMAIRLHLASGQPAVTREPETEGELSNEELFNRVQEVIDTLVNPAVAGHGGYVRLMGVDKDIAYVQLGGGCHGCGMAAYTLKQGVAQAIRTHVPEISEVLDSTDHTTGTNPYYAPQR